MMKFYTETVVKKARELRRRGLSGRKISRKLGVSDTTILRWCADIPSDNNYYLKQKKSRENIKNQEIDLIKNIELTTELAKLFASILYWCEGAKYPSTNFISFSNSDAELIKTFIKLFRIGFEPKENKFRASLQLHSNHDKEKMTEFWSQLLKIPKSQFYKPTITDPTKRMKRRNYKGTCTIRYYNVPTLLKLIGIYESFFKKLNRGGVG